MTSFLDRLDALAAKATPGPWESVPVIYAGQSADGKKSWVESEGRIVNGPPQTIEHDTLSARWFTRKQDGDYIAALSPQVVLALTRALRAAIILRAGVSDDGDTNPVTAPFDAALADLEKLK